MIFLHVRMCVNNKKKKRWLKAWKLLWKAKTLMEPPNKKNLGNKEKLQKEMKKVMKVLNQLKLLLRGAVLI